jgi:myosin heavy subunit
VQELGREEREARVYLEGYPVHLDENTMLREGVNKLRQELSDMEAEGMEEVKRVRREVFEMKMKVELEFRRTKKSLEEEYNAAAHAKMSEESDRAVEECRNLSGKLNEERDRVMDRMKSQREMEVALLLERLVGEQEIVVGRGQREISRLHGEAKGLQKKARELDQSLKKMEGRKKEERRARAEMEGWRNRVAEKVEEVEEWIRGGCQVNEWEGEMEEMGSGNVDMSAAAGTGDLEMEEDDEGVEEGEEEEDLEFIWKTSLQEERGVDAVIY